MLVEEEGDNSICKDLLVEDIRMCTLDNNGLFTSKTTLQSSCHSLHPCFGSQCQIRKGPIFVNFLFQTSGSNNLLEAHLASTWQTDFTLTKLKVVLFYIAGFPLNYLSRWKLNCARLSMHVTFPLQGFISNFGRTPRGFLNMEGFCGL